MKDRNWKFIESWEENGTGLVMTVKKYGYNEKVVMKGVAPSGMSALQEIMKKVGAAWLPKPAKRLLSLLRLL